MYVFALIKEYSLQLHALRAWVKASSAETIAETPESEDEEEEESEVIKTKRSYKRRKTSNSKPAAEVSQPGKAVYLKAELKQIIGQNATNVTKSKAAKKMYELLNDKFPDLRTFATIAKNSGGEITICFDDVSANDLNS